jgi:hypothetical protein
VLLDRLDAMSKGENPYGADGAKAAELLAKRGAVARIAIERRALLRQLGFLGDRRRVTSRASRGGW